MIRIKISSSRSKGITLIELLVGIGILIILAAMSALAFRYFQRESDLNNSTKEIIAILRLAQNKTLASEGASQYGVFFNTSTTPHQYILFKGSDYALRDTSFDEIHKLPQTIEIYEIDLQEGSEVVFNRLTGTTNQSGSISLRLISETSRTKTIYITSSGQVGLTSPSAPSDADRVKDSRHVHFDYSRLIYTSTEKLILTFTYDTSTVSKQIVIANNMKDGHIYWEGEVNVGGEIQKLKIHTHKLNDPNTQFCVHRDRRYNNKVLVISISGDTSGSLIEYSADGLITTSTSLNVSNLLWQ